MFNYKELRQYLELINLELTTLKLFNLDLFINFVKKLWRSIVILGRTIAISIGRTIVILGRNFLRKLRGTIAISIGRSIVILGRSIVILLFPFGEIILINKIMSSGF